MLPDTCPSTSTQSITTNLRVTIFAWCGQVIPVPTEVTGALASREVFGPFPRGMSQISVHLSERVAAANRRLAPNRAGMNIVKDGPMAHRISIFFWMSLTLARVACYSSRKPVFCQWIMKNYHRGRACSVCCRKERSAMVVRIDSRLVWRWRFLLTLVVLFLASTGRANVQGCTSVSPSTTGAVTWSPQWCQEFNGHLLESR